MKTPTCELMLMAMMAAADGESAPLSTDEINVHLSVCADCREEAVRMQRAGDLFRHASRRDDAIDLWTAIDVRLAQQPSRIGWGPFAVVSLLLLVYKLVEMLPEAEPGWAIELAPLIIFGALLVFLRENPFKINTELILEK